MPTIKIKNFLIIKDAEFDIRKINVIIGEQATGKSVIAKLVYFFNSCVAECFTESIAEEYISITDKIITNNIVKKKLKKIIQQEILQKFIEIFPFYSWKNQDFSIVYQSDIYEITLTNKKYNNKYKFIFEYSRLC